MKKSSTPGIFRILAMIVLLAGAAGSLYMMFDAGRNQKSILLIIIFTAWVISPFVALMFTAIISGHWSRQIRTRLFFLACIVSIGSLLAYHFNWSPAGTKTAFKFLVVPLISWLTMAISFLMTASRARRHSG